MGYEEGWESKTEKIYLELRYLVYTQVLVGWVSYFGKLKILNRTQLNLHKNPTYQNSQTMGGVGSSSRRFGLLGMFFHTPT